MKGNADMYQFWNPWRGAAVEVAAMAAPRDYVTNMGWLLFALHNAFYQPLHKRTVEPGMADTIKRGGDTDLTDAIAGTPLGAVHGRDAIPWRWLQVLLTCRPVAGMPTRHFRPQEYWPVDVLELAEALLAAGQGK